MTGSEGSPWAPSSVPALGAVDCEHGPLSDDPLEEYPVYRTLRCMLSVRYRGFAEHDAVQDEKKVPERTSAMFQGREISIHRCNRRAKR